MSLSALMLIAPAVTADVKTEERTKFEFPGVLGGIVKVFGGSAARNGVVSKVALKGDRKMSITDDTGELVDLAQEKVYRLDMKKKTYTVVTFDQMRRQMQEAMDKAKAQAASAQKTEPSAGNTTTEKPPEFEIDFKLAESGQKKKVNGYDSREVTATVTIREKGKPADDGSMSVVSTMWLAPRIPATRELDDFNRRYAEKLYLPFATDNAEQMASIAAMYPGLKEAMGKLDVERVNMDGTAVLTVIRAEATAKPTEAQAPPAQENKQTEIPRSLGGLLGGLGRRAAGRNEPAQQPQSATFMTTSHELLSVSTTVSDADVALPAGFKETK
jgi:hypothetical protein